MNKNHKLFFLILFSFLIIALTCCKMRAEQKSLTAYFEIIDNYISDGDFKSALKELKNVEKMAYDSWSFIGIYKRYIQMGEETKAEKTLKTALKKNSHNQELKAVYSNFLLRKDRIDEAAKMAEELRGGEYGSLFSEAVLKIEQRKNPSLEFPEYYKDEKFYEIYFDAYKAAYNPIWIRNCAIYHLLGGNFENAAGLTPKYYSYLSDAYFWAMVNFDANHFYDCVEAIEVGKKFIDDKNDLLLTQTQNENNPTYIQLTALESDAYLAVSELEKAQEVRSILFKRIEDVENATIEDEELLQMLAMNSIIYANTVDDDVTITQMLEYVVQKWPDYEKGLILYADYAYKCNLPREEDIEVQSLRKLGLKTLEMEKYDNKKRLSLSTAINQIDSALSKENNSALSLEKLDLKYKLDNSFTDKQKTTDLWYLMEESITPDSKYDPLLVEYFLSFLLKTNQYQDAYELFYKFISYTYSFNPQEDFWTQLGSVLPRLDIIQAEFAAYFAACQKMYNETIRFYEYCVYESGGVSEKEKVSPYVSIPSCMNMADIYYSIGKKEKAVLLYGYIIGIETNAYRKSEASYRLACIYVSNGELNSAIKSLDYACSVYPGNARAALLLEKLKNNK